MHVAQSVVSVDVPVLLHVYIAYPKPLSVLYVHALRRATRRASALRRLTPRVSHAAHLRPTAAYKSSTTARSACANSLECRLRGIAQPVSGTAPRWFWGGSLRDMRVWQNARCGTHLRPRERRRAVGDAGGALAAAASGGNAPCDPAYIAAQAAASHRRRPAGRRGARSAHRPPLRRRRGHAGVSCGVRRPLAELTGRSDGTSVAYSQVRRGCLMRVYGPLARGERSMARRDVA